jgi:MFS family permease
MGLLSRAFLLTYTILMTPGGWFIDRFGPRIGWIVVGFGSAAGALLTGVVGFTLLGPMALLAGLFVVRPLMGCANAPLHPTGARLVANWVPPSGASMTNGLLNCAALVGIAVTPPVFGLMIDLLDWPGAFMAAGGVTLVVALVWTLAGADHPPPHGHREESVPRQLSTGSSTDVTSLPTDVAAPKIAFSEDLPAQFEVPARRSTIEVRLPTRLIDLLKDRSLVCLTLGYGLVGYFQYLFFYWVQYYFEQVQKMATGEARWMTSLLTLSMGFGMAVGGWLTDRAPAIVGPRHGLAVVPVLGLLLGAGATLLGVLHADPPWMVIAFAVAMAAVGLGEGAFWTASVRIGGARGGTAAAILNTGGNAIGLLAPALTPFISEWFGWRVGLGSASFVCVVAAALWAGVSSDRVSPGTPSW